MRSYPNYAEGESRKLTEFLLSQDLLTTYVLSDQDTSIVNTKQDGDKRPDTASTAHDAAEHLVQNIVVGEYGSKKEFTILFQTNNPYIERQTIATQREVDKVLRSHSLDQRGYVIKVEGVGFKCKQDVRAVHSEFAALIAERYKTVVEDGVVRRPIKDLLFQTRDNAPLVDSIPTFDNYEVHSLGELFQDLFDEHLY